MTTPNEPPPVVPPPPGKDPLQEYHTIADTVGFVPSLRLKDNVIQLISVAVGAVLGALIGFLVGRGSNTPWWLPPTLGAVGGIITATLISGLVLMVMGWVRTARRK